MSLNNEAEQSACDAFLDEVEFDELSLEDAMAALTHDGIEHDWRLDMVASIREKSLGVLHEARCRLRPYAVVLRLRRNATRAMPLRTDRGERLMELTARQRRRARAIMRETGVPWEFACNKATHELHGTSEDVEADLVRSIARVQGFRQLRGAR